MAQELREVLKEIETRLVAIEKKEKKVEKDKEKKF